MSGRSLPVAFLILATSGMAAVAQSPAPPAMGRISGTVVGAESGTPVRFARVTISPSPSGPGTVLTDESGSFAFGNLVAGTYTLTITKAGYLNTVYGQTRPGTNTPGRSIRLRDREQIERLAVPLSHGGSIAGVIRDDRGEPAFHATVKLQRWVMRSGVRKLETVDATSTDERGMYRFSLLPSRQYLVSAAPADDAIPEAAGNRPLYGFVPMFYPGVTAAPGAAPITLDPGEDRANVDLHLPLLPLARITGTVLDGDGRPVPNAAVSLVDSAGAGDGGLDVAPTNADGRFTFQRVVPGSYVAVANTGGIHQRITFRGRQDLVVAGELNLALNRLGAALDKSAFTVTYASGRADATSAAPRGSAAADVSATAGLMSEVVLRLEPLRDVTGRIVFNGTAPRPAAANVRITLTAIDESAGAMSVPANADGTFTVEDVPPGKYEVTAAGGGNVWVVASAMTAGGDALDLLLDVPRERDVRDLTITFEEHAAELSGQALDGTGQPALDRTVVIFPLDERLWPTADRRIKSSMLSGDGRFAFTGLPPGSYRLALVEGLEPDEWRDPQFLKQLVAASIPVTLGEGEKKTQDIRTGGR